MATPPLPVPQSVMDKADAYIAGRLETIKQEERAGRRAVADPLPGPIGEVFQPVQDITVGPFKVRPFYDIDFEVLKVWDHPVYRMMLAEMSGNESEDFIPRGPQAWRLFWLMTTHPEQVDDLCTDAVQMDKAAKAKFGRGTFAQFIELYKAVVQQIGRYSSVAVQYGGAEEEAKAALPPTPAP